MAHLPDPACLDLAPQPFDRRERAGVGGQVDELQPLVRAELADCEAVVRRRVVREQTDAVERDAHFADKVAQKGQHVPSGCLVRDRPQKLVRRAAEGAEYRPRLAALRLQREFHGLRQPAPRLALRQPGVHRSLVEEEAFLVSSQPAEPLYEEALLPPKLVRLPQLIDGGKVNLSEVDLMAQVDGAKQVRPKGEAYEVRESFDALSQGVRLQRVQGLVAHQARFLLGSEQAPLFVCSPSVLSECEARGAPACDDPDDSSDCDAQDPRYHLQSENSGFLARQAAKSQQEHALVDKAPYRMCGPNCQVLAARATLRHSNLKLITSRYFSNFCPIFSLPYTYKQKETACARRHGPNGRLERQELRRQWRTVL